MRKLIAGVLALAWVALAMPLSAHAEGGEVVYKPGALKAAIEQGKTVLLHYKSTW